jgi:N-acetylated-alpha-linked acidic dipeptidase
LAAASSTTLNFVALRAAIRSLQFASLKFDAEKFAAERVLDRQLRKWRKHHKRPHERKDGCLKRFIHRLERLFTRESHDVPAVVPMLANDRNCGSDHDVNVEDGIWPHLPLPKHPHWPPRKPPHLPPKFVKAIKAVRKINQKLASFERGFIHEDGIKDREWYRLSINVNRRKCLTQIDSGYGATTLPALTEAITIEKDVTLAKYEIVRLTEAVEKMTDALRA